MKIGIFISEDGGVISSKVDIENLKKHYEKDYNVRVFDDFFAVKTREEILNIIKSENLEGIVFVGNSPRYFDKILSGNNLLDELVVHGIEKTKIAFANIKEHIIDVNSGSKEELTNKAKVLVNVAISKVKNAHHVDDSIIYPIKKVVIVGTSPGGIYAANQLHRMGFSVAIIEKDSKINDRSIENAELNAMISYLHIFDEIDFYFNAKIEDFYGWAGNYKFEISRGEEVKHIHAGGIILANNDDKEWLQQLKYVLHLNLNKDGHLWNRLNSNKDTMMGKTFDEGFWFIPYKDDIKVEEEFASASMATCEISNILNRREIHHPVFTATVDESKCGGCGACVKTCAFHASELKIGERRAIIEIERCKGCGNCVVSCPTSSRDLINYPQHYYFDAIDVIADSMNKEKTNILVFACRGCGYIALDQAYESKTQYPLHTYPIEVECGGSIDTQYVLKALKSGFDGVALTICNDGECQHIVGNVDMIRRVSLFREILRERGFDSDVMRIINTDCDAGEELSKELTAFYDEVSKKTRGDMNGK
jgi:F420-non-reducing hydrogenase iron-sulfur subunit